MHESYGTVHGATKETYSPPLHGTRRYAFLRVLTWCYVLIEVAPGKNLVSERQFGPLADARHVKIHRGSDRGRFLFAGRHEVRWISSFDNVMDLMTIRRLLAVGLETGEIFIYCNLIATPGKWEVTSSIPVGYAVFPKPFFIRDSPLMAVSPMSIRFIEWHGNLPMNQLKNVSRPAAKMVHSRY